MSPVQALHTITVTGHEVYKYLFRYGGQPSHELHLRRQEAVSNPFRLLVILAIGTLPRPEAYANVFQGFSARIYLNRPESKS